MEVRLEKVCVIYDKKQQKRSKMMFLRLFDSIKERNLNIK